MRLKTDLFQWYQEQRKINKDRPLTEVSDLTTGMLGTAAKPKLATKAAETRGLLKFCVQYVGELKDKLPRGAQVLAAGKAIETFMEVMQKAPK
eukprot:10645046-Alexandrium_andersonii.AAC.1